MTKIETRHDDTDASTAAGATDRPPDTHRPLPAALLPLIGAVALWMWALNDIDLDRMTDVGLLSVLPAAAYVALALLALSFVWSLRSNRQPGWLSGAHIAVLALLIHATPAALYGTLRYEWAYKHVGMVDYIMRHGSVDPTIQSLGVYHNWPGFFAFNAMLTSTAGFSSALSYASWAPALANLLLIGVIALIARELLDDQRTVATATWLFVLTNWVGQDYFAPQALTYLWYLVVIFVVLRWLGREPTDHTLPTGHRQARWWVPFRTRHLARGRLEWHDHLVEPHLTSSTPREWLDDPELQATGKRFALMLFVVLLIWCIVSVHQLTPIALAVALTALLLGSRLSVGTLPLLVLVLTVEWVIDVAEPFTRSNLAEAADSVGNVGGNVAGTLIGYGQTSGGQILVSLMARSLTVSIALLAVYGFIRSLRRERLGPVVLLAMAPAALVAISGYGSEVLFRTYLFALPFLVIVASTGLLRPRPAVSLWEAGRLLVVSLLLGGMLLFAYYGNEDRYHFSPQEVAAARYVMERGPANTLLIEGSRNYPAQFLNYERFTYVPIDREPVTTRQRMTTRPVPTLTEWMSNDEYADAYLIITASQKAETSSRGEMPPGALDHIEAALRRSDRFDLVYENSDASVFKLAGRAAVTAQDG